MLVSKEGLLGIKMMHGFDPLLLWKEGVIVSLLTILAVFFYRGFYKKRSNQTWLEALNKIINDSDKSWLFYNLKSRKFKVSKDYLELVGLNKVPETFSDIIMLLTSSTAQVFKEHIKSLVQEKTPFQIEVSTKTGRTLEIRASFLKEHNQIFMWWENASLSNQKIETLEAELGVLRTQERILKYVLDMLPTPVWFRDLKGHIRYCNKSYAQALDLKPDTILQQNRLLWGYNSTSFKQEITSPLTNEIKKYLVFDGERRLMGLQEYYDSAQGMAGFSVDLTELKNAVSELERHTASYREVLENLSAGIAIYGSDKRIKFFNQAYSRMFDMDEDWLLTGPTLAEVLDDLRQRRTLPEHADYSAYKKNQMQMVTTIMQAFQELIHLPDERTIRKVTAPHPIGGIFYIYEDITDSLILERKYNTQLAVQRTSLDNLYEGICVFGSDGRLRLTNAAYRRLWKLNPSQVKEGIHITDMIEMCKEFFILKSDWNSHKQKLLSIITDRVPKKYQIQRTDSTALDFSYIPLPDGSHLMSCIDITDTQKLEKILRERNENGQEEILIHHEIRKAVNQLHPQLKIISDTLEQIAKQNPASLSLEEGRTMSLLAEESEKTLKSLNKWLEIKSHKKIPGSSLKRHFNGNKALS